MHLDVLQSGALFLLFKTRLGLNVCACAVYDAECACVIHSVANVAVKVIKVGLTVLAPVLYHKQIEISPRESREEKLPGSARTINRVRNDAVRTYQIRPMKVNSLTDTGRVRVITRDEKKSKNIKIQ